MWLSSFSFLVPIFLSIITFYLQSAFGKLNLLNTMSKYKSFTKLISTSCIFLVLFSVTLAAPNTITFNDALYDLKAFFLRKYSTPAANGRLGFLSANFNKKRANAFACRIDLYISQFSQPTDWVRILYLIRPTIRLY